MFATLPARADLAGTAVTADAMHAQRARAEYLVAQHGAHYPITVKRNQPGLHAQLAAMPWRHVPAADDALDRGRGRSGRRTLKVTAVAAGLAFPHAVQAIQIARRHRPLNSKKRAAETIYAITSLTAAQASPGKLAAIVRGHR